MDNIDLQLLPDNPVLRSAIESLVLIFGGLVVKTLSNSVVKTMAAKVLNRLNRDALARQRADTLANLARSAFSIVIFGIITLMVLDIWGIDIRPILTGVGIVGLAAGIGAQTLVKDTVTGLFISVENQFNVGDKVKVANIEGKVLEMNIRTTVIQDDNGTMYIIPNSQISTVANYSKKDLQ